MCVNIEPEMEYWKRSMESGGKAFYHDNFFLSSMLKDFFLVPLKYQAVLECISEILAIGVTGQLHYRP